MKRIVKGFPTRPLLLLLVSVAVLLPWNLARADFLYWAAPTLKTGSVRTGYSFAQTALRNQGAQSLRVSANEVAGSIGRTYVAITCIGTPRVTAVVMAVGPDGGETSRVRDAVSNAISKIVSFD
jgi:hypothetical protein